jgi:hypothetical protein
MKAGDTLLAIQSCPKLTELEIRTYEDDRPPHGIAVVNNCLRKLYLNVEESCARFFKGLTFAEV